MTVEAQSDTSLPELSIVVSPHEELPKSVKAPALLEEARFILELLAAELPDDFPLDGSDELEIRLGDSGDDPRYEPGKERAVVYQTDFDFMAWKKASKADKREVLLDALAGIVDRVTHAFRGDRKPIKEAVKKIKRAKFEAQVAEPDLSAPVPEQAKGAELVVLRKLTPDGEEWWVEVRNKAGRLLKKDKITDDVSTTEARKLYADSKWVGTEYRLFDKNGKLTYSLELPEAES